ncbi:triose-phosphate isomerase [Candidatus Micrarchaeota archaeon]|nr:triose-phosphate isomerase [Candidatus Micrarchaeota archaeon]
MVNVFLNFKAYKESAVPNSEKLVSAALGFKNVFICPQQQELLFLRKKFPKAKIFAQDCESNEFGAFTGSIGLTQLKSIGVNGSLLNHSERKKPFNELKKIILEANKIGFKLVVCVDSLSEAKKIIELRPWAIAFEPPELIGSGKSVSTHEPVLVKKFINLVGGKSIPLIGAGVSNHSDFVESIALGAEGVLLASAFVKSKNPKKWLKEFV